jgi:Stress responsive A/B Barrel Domain
MQQMLNSLKNNFSMIKEFEVGIGITKLDSSNCDIVLVSSFKSLKDLESYLVHPEHKKISEFIGKIRESRACIDYEY